jgi:plastocyanin
MKRSNSAVRQACCLVVTFAMAFLSSAESGDRSIGMAAQKESAIAITIVDQNGQLSPNGVPSATSQIVDVTVGQGFVFVPDELNISAGDTVRWTWASSGHSVTSGDPCTADGQFCSPNNTNCAAGVLSNIGTVYEHTFAQAGTYSYFCSAHCSIGMTGVINVAAAPRPTPRPRPSPPPRSTPPRS